MEHFVPHVKNGLAIGSSVKYRGTRLNNISTWKTKLLSEPNNFATIILSFVM